VADVAARAGVSSATAARALGGYGRVSDATRARVTTAAHELGYRVNGIARSMVTGQTRTLGLVVADIENPFFAAATRGFGDVARDAGYDVMVVSTDEDPVRERSALGVLVGRRVDGVAVSPASDSDPAHLIELVRSGQPLVLLDRAVRGVSADVVGIDNRVAARLAVEHLVAAGHTRIAMLAGAGYGGHDGPRNVPEALMTGRDRVRGYDDALAEAGLEPPPGYRRVTHFRSSAARAATRELLCLPEPPTAVFCSDSLLSLGVLAGAADVGAIVPRDLSLVAFDDADWMDVVTPPVTVMDQPAYDIGAQAAGLLLRRIDGDRARRRRVLLPTRLIERSSVAPPRHAPRPRARRRP
jgi:LacI family transcriptional regulator